MIDKFKSELQFCLSLNKTLHASSLVIDTFGNLSQRLGTDYFCIKPSGVDPHEIELSDIPIIDIDSGEQVFGNLRPSSDTPTHRHLYRERRDIGGVVHTHSIHATAFAQAGQSIHNIGTTHSDYWREEIPITRELAESEVESDYELNTGVVILEALQTLGESCLGCPGVLVRNHGPFTWGEDSISALRHAELLEYIAHLSILTHTLGKDVNMPDFLKKKHYERKHGINSYYGQL